MIDLLMDFSFSKARFSCDEGYLIEGVNPLTCLPDQTWSHTLPICQSKQYPNL